MSDERERAAIEAAAQKMRSLSGMICTAHNVEQIIAAYLAADGGYEGRVAAWRQGVEAGFRVVSQAVVAGRIYDIPPDPTPEELP